jgi:hypothetical protein
LSFCKHPAKPTTKLKVSSQTADAKGTLATRKIVSWLSFSECFVKHNFCDKLSLIVSSSHSPKLIGYMTKSIECLSFLYAQKPYPYILSSVSNQKTDLRKIYPCIQHHIGFS